MATNRLNFRAEFTQRTAMFLNTVFHKEKVLSIIDSLQKNIANEMEDHITKWNSPVSKAAWSQNCNLLKEFAENRNRYMFKHMMDYFNIPDTSRLTIKCSDGGKIAVCSSYILNKDSATFTLFDSIPVNLLALPEPGFTFSGWNNTDFNKQIYLILNKDTTVLASFEKTDQNIIPDTVNGTLILDDTLQPYYSTGNILIPGGDSLIIMDGVNVLMTPHSSIINYGFLRIEGSDTKPVIFDINPDVTDGYIKTGNKKWGAICINSGKISSGVTSIFIDTADAPCPGSGVNI